MAQPTNLRAVARLPEVKPARAPVSKGPPRRAPPEDKLHRAIAGSSVWRGRCEGILIGAFCGGLFVLATTTALFKPIADVTQTGVAIGAAQHEAAR